MSYKILIDQNSRMITVRPTGVLNNVIRKQILSDLAYRLNATGFSKAMVDLTDCEFNPGESMIGALELTRYMVEVGISSQVKLAFVYRNAEIQRKAFEKIAQTMGFSLRYFKCSDEAISWLQ